MRTVDYLIAARELIRDPDHWTQDAYARDEEGYSVDAPSDKAKCWCALGAIIRVVPTHLERGACVEAFVAHFGSPTVYNDSSRHDEILEAFDKVIEALK